MKNAGNAWPPTLHEEGWWWVAGWLVVVGNSITLCSLVSRYYCVCWTEYGQTELYDDDEEYFTLCLSLALIFQPSNDSNSSSNSDGEINIMARDNT